MRHFLHKVIASDKFEMLMGCIVLKNFFVIVYEVDEEAPCIPLPAGFAHFQECKESLTSSGPLVTIIMGLLCVYTVEVLVRGYAERLEFFKVGWNNLDLVVVAAGWISQISFDDQSTVTAVRLLRTLRVMRMFRILIAFRELYVIFLSLVSTCKSLIGASAMLAAMLTMWSIIMVEHIHPLAADIDFEGLYGCVRCSEAYSTIMKSNLTLFQNLVAGDS